MIRIGDCLTLARSLPDNSVDCIVTSPPYWGLRDYGTADAWGLEPTLAEYLDRLGSLFAELRRALRPTGTCWVNLGDAYVASKTGDPLAGTTLQGGKANQIECAKRPDKKVDGLAPKNLIGLPWRVAFMLQDQGWYLRQEIIWHKPNPMPESVTDRCTRSHEQIFMLTKSPRYFYDQDAIAERVALATVDRLNQPNQPNQLGSERANGGGKTNGNMKAVVKKQDGHGRRFEGFNERYFAPSARDNFKRENSKRGAPIVPGQAAGTHRADREDTHPGTTRNARSVWTVATIGYADAHFAVFPPELPKRCISAGCPVGGTVLDPFTGSGTTGMVAKQLGREFIGFEVNPEYAKMAERRIADVTPSLFSAP